MMVLPPDLHIMHHISEKQKGEKDNAIYNIWALLSQRRVWIMLGCINSWESYITS